MEARATFPPVVASVRDARAFVVAALDGRVQGLNVDSVALAVSELVANAVLHARTDVGVAVLARPDLVRVAVSDLEPRVPQQRKVGSDEPHGRGLLIVDQLAHRWGVTPDGAGKSVWVEWDLG